MCDHLDLDSPKLEEDDTIRFEGEQAGKKLHQREDEAPKETDQFENEDEYNFYANFIDLKEHVPETLLFRKAANQQQQHQQQQQNVGISPGKAKEDENQPDTNNENGNDVRISTR